MSDKEQDVDSLFDRCFDLVDSGVDLNDLLVYLHEQGATFIEAWHLSGKLYGGMEKSARAIVNHPLWQADLKAMETTPVGWAEHFNRYRLPVTQ